MDKKTRITLFCWIAAAIIWAIMAGIYFSEGKVGFACVQAVIAVLFAVNAVIIVRAHKKRK